MPTPRRAKAARSKTAKRKIHFYRAVVPAVKGKPGTFDPTAAFTRIDKLKFNAQGRYLQDGDRILCCWIERAAKHARARFAVIRREGLPSIEDGGVEQDLSLGATAGLVEQIHVQCFDHNIVGCDFNFYGPRLPSLSRYLNQRGGPSEQAVTFEPLVRHDVADLLNGFSGLRAATLRVRRSEIDALEKIDRGLGKALRAQRQLAETEVVEVGWNVTPYSRGETLGKRMFTRVKKLAKRSDIHELAGRFTVEAIPSDGGRSKTLNILDDHLIGDEEIQRTPGRGRGLDHDSAFTAIASAHEQLKDELIKASSVIARRSDGDGDGN
jgi:hypothetical protein